MKKTLIKLILLCLLGFTFVTLCANNCYGEGYSWREAQAKAEEEKRQPGQSTSQQNAVEPKITYPVEDMIIEVNLGNRAAMSVQTDGLRVYAYIWLKYQDGEWIDVDQGIAGGNDIYTTPYAVEKKHDGEQYRCEVIFGVNGDDGVKTSPTFTIKVREKKETSASSPSRVSSASEPLSIPNADEVDPDHEHQWEEETKTVNEYKEVTTITYRCKGCTFSTTEKRAMLQHVDETKKQKGHGGFRDDYVFEYKTLPVNGYACNGCDFTTQDKAAMEAHDAANQPVEGHGGYESNVIISYYNWPDVTVYICNNCNTQLAYSNITAHMTDNHPAHTVSGGYQCNQCSVVFASDMAWEEHTADCAGANDAGYTQLSWACVCGDTFTDEAAAKAHETPGGSWRTETQSGGISPIYGYKCKGCDFTTQSEAEMKAHDAQNQPIAGHGGYQTNVQIGTEERPIMGYKCNGCNFTTKKKSEIERHNEKNQAQVGHGGYTATEQTKNVKTGEKKVKTGYRICTICKAKEKIEDDTVRTN